MQWGSFYYSFIRRTICGSAQSPDGVMDPLRRLYIDLDNLRPGTAAGIGHIERRGQGSPRDGPVHGRASNSGTQT